MFDSVWPQRRQPTRLPRPWDSPGKNTGVGCHFLLQCMKVKSESEVALSCPTLRDPMDCSLPGYSVHGNFQARLLEWVAIAFSDLALDRYIFKSTWKGIEISSDIKLKRLEMYLKCCIITNLFSMKFTEPIWSYSYFHFRGKFLEV